MEKDYSVESIVMTGFFAAITFLGIQMFRLPLPAAVGTPFVHFGHIFVVMGVLLLGGKRGAISGTLGLIIFDVLNGYMKDVPTVFIETVVKCLIIGALFAFFQKRAQGDSKKEYRGAVICAVVYGVMNVVTEFVMGTITLMITGSSLMPALYGSLTSLPATAINAVFMIVVVSVIYVPIRSVFYRAALKRA